MSAATGDIATAEAELIAARTARDELAAERARGEITAAEWAPMRRVLMERMDHAEHAVAVAGSSLSAMKNVPSGAAARKWWAAATTAQKRVVIQALIKSVEIAPATNSAPKLDPARVGDPVWIV
jgi:hypothetical protein